MARRLLVVEDRFLIKGRGLVPVPGISLGDERTRVGDPIELRRPDATTLVWEIGGSEWRHGAAPDKNATCILLKDLGKDEVPIGTEIWLTH